MGYESQIYVGNLSEPEDVYEEDKTKPYADCSGYEYLKDEDGEFIPTGYKKCYFNVTGMLDLCCCGHESHFLDVVQKNRSKLDLNLYPYIYSSDGNTEVNEDCCGDKLVPVPFHEALDALLSDYNSTKYRRFKWAINLLEGIQLTEGDKTNDYYILHYGH